MHLPRLRIAHQLSLLLSASVVLAVMAVGGLSVWNLHSGFLDYLRLRDEEQLTRFVQLVERHAATATPAASMGWLTDDPQAARDLMDEFNGRPVRGRRPPPPPPEWGHDEPPPPPRPHGPRPGPGGPGAPAGNLAERVVILDLDGRRLAGRPQPPNAPRTVRAVKVAGVEVARIELIAEQEPEGMDARFLQRQYTGLLLAGLATVVLVVLMGWWVATRWSRPLQALQKATRRIALGERDVHIPMGQAHGAFTSGALEIDQLISDVNAMADGLSALEESRRTWIAQISHELRTPLAVLRGELESIEDGARQPTPAVMRSLSEEVAQLNRLVDDLHTLTMADLGQMPCEFARCDVNPALQRIAVKFTGRATQLGLALTLTPADGPLTAHWDLGRIEQLLSNLLENSLRYTSAPGQIQVNWQADAHRLHLTVQDSAPGVSPHHLPKLFDALFRADASRTRTGQHGSGLGLSIVQAIARAHRGQVDAQVSTLGGICIQVVLPLNPQRLERRKREP